MLRWNGPSPAVLFVPVLLCGGLPSLVRAQTAGFEQAQDLERQGRFAEAAALYERSLPALEGGPLCDALDALARIGVAGGRYEAAASYALRAAELASRLGDDARRARALNRAGLARLHQGRYPEALALFRQALAADKAAGDPEGQVLRWNNIGLVHFYEGSYAEARAAYGRALAILDGNGGASWHARRRYLTLANLAALLQRLGRLHEALDLYLSLRSDAAALPPAHRARLLGNLGALYRRLGDPEKALEQYRRARRLFARERDLDGELGVLKNTGIVLALDVGRPQAALQVFDQVRMLARRAGDRREEMQAELYRGVALFRLGRLSEASTSLESSLSAAAELETPEEEWKALYWLGNIANRAGDHSRAASLYRRAAGIIESLRAGIAAPGLRTEFFADKRDVYDALIGLALRDRTLDSAAGTAAEALAWMERSRARQLQDLLSASPAGGASVAVSPEAVQKRLPEGAALLVYWLGSEQAAVLWFTRNRFGLRRFAWSAGARRRVLSFTRRLAAGSWPGWRRESAALGRELLAGLPPLTGGRIRRLIIVPDGVLGLLPFETLETPAGASGAGSLLLERFAINYLPASALLLRPPPSRDAPRLPWRLALLGFANPAVQDPRWPPLPAAEREIAALARMLPGSAELHMGRDVRLDYLTARRGPPPPVIHLATHAAASLERPADSRILFAPPDDRFPADYLRLDGIAALDLNGVALVTLSACDTERSRLIRGEGILAFSRAFLAAGARAVVTSLWKVPDDSTAALMERWYHGLARGLPPADALREAKMAFLDSGGSLAEPYFWAAFVLNGDGWRPVPLPWRWSRFLTAIAVPVLLALSLWLRRRSRSRPPDY